MCRLQHACCQCISNASHMVFPSGTACVTVQCYDELAGPATPALGRLRLYSLYSAQGHTAAGMHLLVHCCKGVKESFIALISVVSHRN